jgi:hypothetical protein
LWSFGIFFPVLVYRTEKNLATLPTGEFKFLFNVIVPICNLDVGYTNVQFIYILYLK